MLGEFIADEHAPSAYERASADVYVDAVRRMLDTLNERERRVLELRYGLCGEEPCTATEVSRRFNVSRERIRQIESRSLSKLERLAERRHAARAAVAIRLDTGRDELRPPAAGRAGRRWRVFPH